MKNVALGVLLSLVMSSPCMSATISDSIDLTDSITFNIMGRNRDGYQVLRDGEILCYHWLYPHASNAGDLNKDEVVSRKIGNSDINIAFRWGGNDDLMFAIAIRGNNCYSTIGEYWSHAESFVNIKWTSDDVVRFYSEKKQDNLKFSNGKWHWIGH